MKKKNLFISSIAFFVLFAGFSASAQDAVGTGIGADQYMIDVNNNDYPDAHEDFDGDGILNKDDDDYQKPVVMERDADGGGILNIDDEDYVTPKAGTGNSKRMGLNNNESNGTQDGVGAGVSDGSGYDNDNGKKANIVGDGSRAGMALRQGEAQFKNEAMYNRVKGKILIKPEDSGKAYYVNPKNGMMRSLGRPADAFAVMREEGLGISNSDFETWNGIAPESLAGKILLKVEDLGQAYYVDPETLEMLFLNRPADAFNIMRNLGLGISNADFDSCLIEQ